MLLEKIAISIKWLQSAIVVVFDRTLKRFGIPNYQSESRYL